MCVYYLVPSLDDGFDTVKIELEALNISNSDFESTVFIYDSKFGDFNFKGDFYTGDKLTIDVKIKDGELLALIGKPILDLMPYKF